MPACSWCSLTWFALLPPCLVQVELAQLAQVASSLDRHSPYAWCVLGNCFSLQKVRRAAGGAGAGWMC